MKKIPVKLKGTRYNFYFDHLDYSRLEKMAKESNESIEDYLYDAYKGSFFEARVKLSEAVEDLRNEIYKELKPALIKIEEFLKKNKWLLFKIRFINRIRKIFKIRI